MKNAGDKTTCPGCKVALEFRRGPKGNLIPIEVRPVIAYVLDDRDGPQCVPVKHVDHGGELHRIHLNHFQTCPYRDRFRQAKR